MNKRLLIISPHFPPINAPDHQRIRTALPYFQEFSWEVSVLSTNPDFIEGIKDPNLIKTIPNNIDLIKCNAISPRLSRKLKLGDLGIRSIPFFIKSTTKYFKEGYFDLVYFSNTVFLTMTLGRYWWDRYKVPYVLDFQDPWLSNYYEQNQVPLPGGKLKYTISRSLAKILEPYTLKKVSHVTSVSPDYSETLMKRYHWLKPEQFTVLPFGAPEYDFEILPQFNIQQNIFNPTDGNIHWVYVGRAAEDMFFTLKSLFSAIQQHRKLNPQQWQKIKIHFIGTKYSIFDNTKEIEEIAKTFGLENIVFQYPQRIPYFEALQVLKDSHGILILGSDDSSYSPSKIYPCVLARKPILGILHQASLATKVLKECQAGRVVQFNHHSDVSRLDQTLIQEIEWLIESSHDHWCPETNFQAFDQYTAKQMTKNLCDIFNQLMSSNSVT
ncbi:hypothetical protein [Nodularia spumigena]|uniref:hypothetical protein n=1 Tax=Nodularia spumigena TaxID=70799 RepID=UPI00232E878D|nr:hypothetical protein [Nodularia spumigena]MDB9347414.1 hypothetical protein [Nodularia spumigena CS-588/01]MDB9354460.1 hypothetical protein [Nodularia spumigena CS-588/05]